MSVPKKLLFGPNTCEGPKYNYWKKFKDYPYYDWDNENY
jgi:hypothetical protein